MSGSSFIFAFIIGCLTSLGEVDTDSSCIHQTQNCTSSHNSRDKRYLLFGEGTSLTITGSAVKTIVSGIPRGMNLILEETIYYQLPYSVSIPKLNSTNSQKLVKLMNSMKTTATQGELRTPFNMKYASLPEGYSPRYSPYVMRKRRAGSPDKGFSNHMFSLLEGIEDLPFQVLSYFAKLYNFNERYCIMRTICEARFVLFPKGVSAFHDLVRTLLEGAMPTIRRNKKYLRASQVKNPMDCANLYGPHCRISFLIYFTNEIHGKHLRWELKENWSRFGEDSPEENIILGQE